MSKLLLNARKLDFQNTLGVTAFYLNLAQALSKSHEITLVVAPNSNWRESERAVEIAHIASDILTVDEAAKAKSRFFDHVEICPHHFQDPEFCRDSIVICHDLHIFDIPWKYKDVETRHQKFRETMLKASAVMTHFPRTYYHLESRVGRQLRNLFLTEAPLMFEPLKLAAGPPKPRPRALLYPAQFQEHKGHKALITAAKKLADSGETFELLFCGTDFDEAYTKSLRDLAAKLGLEQAVKFLGRLTDEELANHYRDCHGVITASAAEGGAYVPMEALSCSKPVAVNGIESARMHLKSLRAEVIWFDATSEASTAEAMRQLLKADVAAMARKNELARARLASISWDAVADKWTSVIHYLKRETLRPIQSLDGEGWRIALQ